MIHHDAEFDRTILVDPASRKAMSAEAATKGPLSAAVNTLEVGARLLAQGKLERGIDLVKGGFLAAVQAMGINGYVDDETDYNEGRGPTPADIREACDILEYVVRRFRQGYDKAAVTGLHDALACLGIGVAI